MKTSSPKLSWLLPVLAGLSMTAVAQPPATPELPTSPQTPAADQARVPDGHALVAQALIAMERHERVTARLRHRCDLFGHSVVGSGSFAQGPAGQNLTRLELQLQLGQQTSTLVQICDGKQLWTHRDLLGNQRLWMIDLDRIREAREQGGQPPALSTTASLGMGGLPQLLHGLQDAFDFTTVKETRLGSLPVWSIEAVWKPLKLKFMLTGQLKEIAAGKPLDLSKLPEHMPDHVVLYLGRDDLFPYRVEYRRAAGTQEAAKPNPIQRGKALVTLELYDVAVNGPLDPAAFTYQPGDQAVIDETDAYLTTRGLLPKK